MTRPDLHNAAIGERLELAITQIGEALSAATQPMHACLQGIIDVAVDDWSTGPQDREALRNLIGGRITVPKRTAHTPVLRLPKVDRPLEMRHDWNNEG